MDESEIDLRSIIGLLRRRLALIVSTTVLIVGVAATIAFTLTPLYTASALIMVDPSRKNILEDANLSSSTAADNARIDSEVELARSDNVLLKVIERERLISDPEFGVSVGLRSRILSFFGVPTPDLPSGEDALNQTLVKLRGAVTVQRRGLTYLISMQVRSESPQRAARLANALAEVYIQDQLSSKVSGAISSLSVLQGRLDQARNSIATSESTYDEFIASNIDTIARDSGRTDLANLQNQIAALEASRRQTASLANTVQTA
ncbi:MAG: Wzz/FepE/Etk N-terminal domain-containing protein, partial [Anaerolineales bacterium]